MDDLWEGFISRPEIIAKQERDKVSYVWDGLIESFCKGGFEGKNWQGPGLSETEKALRVLALEYRFNRRMLGDALYGFLLQSKAGKVGARCLQSRSGVGYVFFAYDSQMSIEERRQELIGRCFAAILLLGECHTIIGINMNIPGHIPVNGFSSDLIMLQAPDGKWSNEDHEKARFCQEELGYFKQPNETSTHEDEYPPQNDV